MKNLIQTLLKLKVGHKVNMAECYFFLKHNVVKSYIFTLWRC